MMQEKRIVGALQAEQNAKAQAAIAKAAQADMTQEEKLSAYKQTAGYIARQESNTEYERQKALEAQRAGERNAVSIAEEYKAQEQAKQNAVSAARWAGVASVAQAKQESEEKNTGGKSLAIPIPTYEPPTNLWIKFWDWYTGKDVGYEGPQGWSLILGHGPRRWISEQIGLDNTASNIRELLLQSLLQEDEVYLRGQAFEKVMESSASYSEYQRIVRQLIKEEIKNNPKYKQESFSYNPDEYLSEKQNETRKIDFGGETSDKDELWLQGVKLFNGTFPISIIASRKEYPETWAVAENELTWMLRNAYISSDAYIDKDGSVLVTYRIEDKLDLSPDFQRRSFAYNIISMLLGAPYHGILGGNPEMKTVVEWQEVLK